MAPNDRTKKLFTPPVSFVLAQFILVSDIMAASPFRPGRLLVCLVDIALQLLQSLTKRDGLLQLEDLITFHFVATP